MAAVQEPPPPKSEVLLEWTFQKVGFAASGSSLSLVSIEKQIVLGQKAKILLLRNPRQPDSMSQPKSFKFLLFHNEGSRRRAHRLSIYVHLGDFYGQALHGLPHPHLPHPKSQLLGDISQITVTFALRLTSSPQ